MSIEWGLKKCWVVVVLLPAGFPRWPRPEAPSIQPSKFHPLDSHIHPFSLTDGVDQVEDQTKATAQ